jgi:hypothetical protein
VHCFFLITMAGCHEKGNFRRKRNGQGIVIAPDGIEYMPLAFSGFMSYEGEKVFYAKLSGDEALAYNELQTGFYYYKDDAYKKSVLYYQPADSEWGEYYRRVDCPDLEIKIENAMQFVFQPLTLVNWKNRRGIKGEENVEAFLQELQAIKPLTEAEIIELIESDAAYVEGAIGNSRIYSAMETDDRLVVMWYVITFNHRPYAISAGENMKETYYVLPEKWVKVLLGEK